MERKKPLQRNALIALANLGDRSALPEIHRCATEDVRPVIRGTAVWAIGKLGNKDSEKWLDVLNELLEVEPEEEVLEEVRKAIKQLEK